MFFLFPTLHSPSFQTFRSRAQELLVLLAHRRLRGVRVEDAVVATSVFELLMGNEVAPRREFIVSSSDRLSRESIDA